MKLKFNTTAEKYVKLLNYNFVVDTFQLPEALNTCIHSNIIEKYDYIGLEEVFDNFEDKNSEIEKTLVECKSNVIFIENYLDNDKYSNEYNFLKFGIKTGEKLAERFSNENKSEKIKIIVVFNKSLVNKEQKLNKFASCSVRFYKDRTGDNILFKRDINDYKDFAIIEIDL